MSPEWTQQVGCGGSQPPGFGALVGGGVMRDSQQLVTLKE
jgi:hypothetical protein